MSNCKASLHHLFSSQGDIHTIVLAATSGRNPNDAKLVQHAVKGV
jgi:hypothetical protein